MVWKIFSYPHNPRVFKSIIAGKYNGIEIEYPQDFQFGVDNKKPEFLEMNPFGKVPTLQTDNGAVWESNAIARHVARSGKRVVYGKNDLESSLIDSWLDWSSTALEPAVMQWLGPILGFMPYNKKNEQEAKDKVKANLEVLNRYLEKNTFLVGNRISLADIVVVCSLVMPYKMVFDLPFRQPYRAVNRWFNTLVNQENFKSVLGEVTLCVTPQEPKKQEAKKEEPKKEAPKKQEAPKKEKETKPAAEEDEEEKPEFEEPKKKNPLDLLPKSKFNLEDYKRVYSNNDTRTVALPNLWENFDPEGYCMYFCDYKYGNELSKQTFMTMNLIGGFYQRLETLHKYAMGSTIIIGTPESHTITGCWIFRGTDIPEDMKICDDFELYDWKRVDTNNAADKELVGDYFSWDKPIQGKPFVDGKIFK